MQRDIQFEPNWRRIRAVLAVDDTGSVNRASVHLHYSQPAVTRAIQELEQELGCALFERHHRGMTATPSGRLVITRFRRALDQFASAEAALNALHSNKSGCERLIQHLNQRQLMTLVTLARVHSEPRAARALGLTQPAISASLRQLESHVGMELFMRTRRGMLLTDSGEILARHARLALRELTMACQDLIALQGRIKGHVVIGCLPLAATQLVPMAIDALRKSLPEVSVSVIDGTYDGLVEALRCGEIDLLIGALRPEAPGKELEQEALFDDCLSIVTHRTHPLARRLRVSLKELETAEWITPRAGTPSREAFERVFDHAGLASPKVEIETGNLGMLRSLLQYSQRVAVASLHQLHYEIESGELCVLPIALEGTRRSIGITRRADDVLTPALETIINQLRAFSAKMTPETAYRRLGASRLPLPLQIPMVQ
ncbi:LysR family transcriptional regulator [Larsenimonas salina]|uniref:LysR family transcriptional regulator n=1 Tax=Larsenimonas salina TaxID=1295565 RepID=UPI002074843A|nr:LysR family transcriptional regulator [Larsenimonas salina]